MRMLSDWRFVVTFIATVAGVVVPIWLWQADLHSKSLAIHLVSKVALQQGAQDALPGLQISVDGARLENPHLLIFEIRNDGTKPIPASDFESPIDIRLADSASFVRSRVTRRSPVDLEAEVTTEKQRIGIKPILLNPKDMLTITAITTGETPALSTRARIVGISSIALDDRTEAKLSGTQRLADLATAVAFFISCMLAYRGAMGGDGVLLRQRAAVFIAFVAGVAGSVRLIDLLDELQISGFWYFMGYVLLLMFLSSLAASLINRRRTEP